MIRIIHTMKPTFHFTKIEIISRRSNKNSRKGQPTKVIFASWDLEKCGHNFISNRCPWENIWNRNASFRDAEYWSISSRRRYLGQRVIIRHNGNDSKHTVLVCLWKANPPTFYVDKFDLPLSFRKKVRKFVTYDLRTIHLFTKSCELSSFYSCFIFLSPS